MDDTHVMGRSQSARQPGRYVHRLTSRKRPGRGAYTEGLAVEQLHGDTGSTIVKTEVVNREDVRTREGGGDALLGELRADHGVARSRCRAQLSATSTCAAAWVRLSNSTKTNRLPEGSTSQFAAGAVDVTKPLLRFSSTTRGGPK